MQYSPQTPAILDTIALLDAEAHEQFAAYILVWPTMQRHKAVSTPFGTSGPGALPLALCMPAAMVPRVLSTAAAAMTPWGEGVPLMQGRPDCLQCSGTVPICAGPVQAGSGQRRSPGVPRMDRVWAIKAPAQQLLPW